MFALMQEHHSRLTFLKGTRFYAAENSSYSLKRNIMWKEYTSYMQMYKKMSVSITRKRCMAVIEQMYASF